MRTWFKSSLLQPFSFYYLRIELENIRMRMFLNFIVSLLLLPVNIVISFLKISVSLLLFSILSIGYLTTLIIDNDEYSKSVHFLWEMVGKYALSHSILFFIDLYAVVINLAKLSAGMFIPDIGQKVIDKKYSPFDYDTQEIFQKDMVPTHLYLGLLILRHLYSDKITQYGLNPDSLTPEQQKVPPTICIHGYGHNQSGWLPLAEYLSSKEYGGALFVINVPSEASLDFNTYNQTKEWEDSLKLLRELYQKISLLYPKEMNSINLIGHSRGSWIITAFFNELKKEGVAVRAISLDNTFFPRGSNPDEHIHLSSHTFETTHAAMLCDKSIHNKCYRFLSETAKRSGATKLTSAVEVSDAEIFSEKKPALDHNYPAEDKISFWRDNNDLKHSDDELLSSQQSEKMSLLVGNTAKI